MIEVFRGWSILTDVFPAVGRILRNGDGVARVATDVFGHNEGCRIRLDVRADDEVAGDVVQDDRGEIVLNIAEDRRQIGAADIVRGSAKGRGHCLVARADAGVAVQAATARTVGFCRDCGVNFQVRRDLGEQLLIVVLAQSRALTLASIESGHLLLLLCLALRVARSLRDCKPDVGFRNVLINLLRSQVRVTLLLMTCSQGRQLPSLAKQKLT